MFEILGFTAAIVLIAGLGFHVFTVKQLKAELSLVEARLKAAFDKLTGKPVITPTP